MPCPLKSEKAPDTHCLYMCLISGTLDYFWMLLCYMMSVFGLDSILARLSIFDWLIMCFKAKQIVAKLLTTFLNCVWTTIDIFIVDYTRFGSLS